jgi:hypothetical protein
MRMQNFMVAVRVAVAGALLAVAFADPAYSYIDPGSASLWLQGILATIAAVIATISVTWQRVKDFLRRFMKK